jgi:hypothetical protein
MRRWAYDGETPQKVRDVDGHMKWPGKFKLKPITIVKCLPDDVPLYVIKEAVDGGE